MQAIITPLVLVMMFVSGGLRAQTERGESGHKESLLRFDFESRTEAVRAILKNKQATLVKGKGVGGSTALKVNYVGYDRGSKRVIGKIDLPRKLDHATLHFDVLFSDDFQFVKGGKLHGLGPENRVTGGNRMTPSGWSARIMFQEHGILSTYTYCHNKDTKWGRSGNEVNSFTFDNYRGTYVTVSLYVRLNHPERKNGRSVIWVNGKKVHEDRGIQYRTVNNEKSKIQFFLFSTFHGGHTPDWAPRTEDGEFKTVTAYFDNFEVYPGKHLRKPIPPKHR